MDKPMSEQIQKLADRYAKATGKTFDKATGKKFNAKTNAQKIRSMSDEEVAKFLFQVGYNHRWGLKEYTLEMAPTASGG